MALPSWTIDRPGQQLGTGAVDELFIERFTGIVEGTIERRSVLAGLIPMQTVTGTNTISKKAVGEATLQTLVPGSTPDGTPVEISRNSLTIDTVVLARNVFPLLETIQNDFDAQRSVAGEHGKKIAKFQDNAFFIQAFKAALLSTPPYGALPGWVGGTKVTMGAAGDRADPVLLFAKIRKLWEEMAIKDVDVIADDVRLYVTPSEYYTLLDNDYLINTEYKTSEGNSVNGMVLKVLGVPVVMTNNLPQSNITNHLLSTAGNSNAYNGDFSKAVCACFSARALLAGSSIQLQSKAWFDDNSKDWKLDTWLSFGVTPDLAAYAGAIYLP